MVGDVFAFNFNPRAPCGARHNSSTQLIQLPYISTHAPLAGRDSRPPRRLCVAGRYFNPRAPCGARRRIVILRSYIFKFQPTRPLRGATRIRCSKGRNRKNFNPRAPCGARRQNQDEKEYRKYFNPRAPCGARQHHAEELNNEAGYFNPRAPCGARLIRLEMLILDTNFNPRAPCGARLDEIILVASLLNFNPRAPCGARP